MERRSCSNWSGPMRIKMSESCIIAIVAGRAGAGLAAEGAETEGDRIASDIGRVIFLLDGVRPITTSRVLRVRVDPPGRMQ